MTKINEIPSEPRERLRGEILGIVKERREQSETSLRQINTYVGVVYTGSTAATLGFMGSSNGQVAKSPVVMIALVFFVFSIISFALLLRRHYQLMVTRDNHYAELADKFFRREADIEDLLTAQQEHQSIWLFRLLFWLPFASFVVGLAAIVIAVSTCR